MIRHLLCALLLSLALPWQALAANPPPTRSTLASAVLAEERGYQVFLPDSYRWATSRRYPVLYLLDAQTNAGHTVASLGFLMQQGEIPELLIVAIDSTIRVRDFTQTDWPEAWVGGGGADRFADFLQHELMPRVEADYRTQPFRILSGHSASGQFALHMLATRPALFDAVLAMAPSLDWDHGLPARELEAALARPGRPSPRFVYFAYGDDLEQALAADVRLAGILRTPGEQLLRVAVGAHPQERHGALPLVATIEGMRALYTGYQLPNTDAPQTLAQAEANFQSLGRRLGIAMPIPESVLVDLGYRTLQAGDATQAIAIFERATRENPESANAWDSLADGHAGARHWQQALEAESKAVELYERHGTGDGAYYAKQVEKYRAKLASP